MTAVEYCNYAFAIFSTTVRQVLCRMLKTGMWHCIISLSVRLNRPCNTIGQTMTTFRLENQQFLSLGTNTLLKVRWPESLSSPSPDLSIVFFSTSEEEAKSEGNKRPRFPPLGLGECRIWEWSKTKWILWPLRERAPVRERRKEGKGKEGGATEEEGWRSHTQKRRQCLLISGVERVEELQTGWRGGTWASSLCSKLRLDRKMDSLWTIQRFMNYVAESWWSCMMIDILLASVCSGDNECFIA